MVTSLSLSATWRMRNSATCRRCTGPFPTRFRRRPRQLRRGASRAGAPRGALRAAPGRLLARSWLGREAPHHPPARYSARRDTRLSPAGAMPDRAPRVLPGHPGQLCDEISSSRQQLPWPPRSTARCSGLLARQPPGPGPGSRPRPRRSGCRQGRCRSPRPPRQARPGPRTCPAWRSSRWFRVLPTAASPAPARRACSASTVPVSGTSTPRWFRLPPWPGFSSRTSLSGGSAMAKFAYPGRTLAAGAEQPGVERDRLADVVDVESELQTRGHGNLLSQDIDVCLFLSWRSACHRHRSLSI